MFSVLLQSVVAMLFILDWLQTGQLNINFYLGFYLFNMYESIYLFYVVVVVYLERVHRPGNKVIFIHCVELPEMSINKAREYSCR